MYTHMIKKSNQECFFTCQMPVKDATIRQKDKDYPMVTTETGQITRVRRSNIRILKLCSLGE